MVGLINVKQYFSPLSYILGLNNCDNDTHRISAVVALSLRTGTPQSLSLIHI